MPQNIIDNLKKAPSTPVEVHQSDPDVVAGVKEFLAAHQVTLEDEAKQKQRVSIAPDPLPGSPGPDAELMREALVPVDDIAITDEEKRIYLKSLLTDELTRFTVSLYDGQLKYELRTRSMFEQRRVLDIVNWRAGLDADLKGNIAKQFDLIQQYFSLLMVERINGTVFSELSLSPGPTMDEHYKILSEAADKVFAKKNTLWWTPMLNAMKIFESKCARLAENAVNEDFWKPRS